MKKCPFCAEEIQDDAVKCKHCGEWLGEEPQHISNPRINITNLSLDQRSILGIIGSIILFIGVFTPIISAPIIGNLNYFQNGKGDGSIILALAIISAILTLRKLYKWLLLTGTISLCVTIYTFIFLQILLSESQIQIIQFQWGWSFLVVGTGCLIASAIIEIKSSDSLVVFQQRLKLYKLQISILLLVLVLITVVGLILYTVKSDTVAKKNAQIAESQNTITSSWTVGKQMGIEADHSKYKNLSVYVVCEKLSKEYFGEYYKNQDHINAFKLGCSEGY